MRFNACIYISVALLAAGSLSSFAQPRTVLGGHFKERVDSRIGVNICLNPLDFVEGRSMTLLSELDKKNNFRAYVVYDKPFSARYLLKDSLLKEAYAYPGDSVWLTVADGRTALTGSNKTLLSFLNKFDGRFHSPEAVEKDSNSFSNPDRQVFAKFQRELKEKKLRFVIEYFVGLPPMQQEMKRLIEADLKYDFALKMLRYSRRHGNEGRFVFRYADYMQPIEEVPSNDPSALISLKYVEYLRELPYSLWYSEINWSMKHKEPYKSTFEGQYLVRDSIARKYFRGEIYELALYAILHDAVSAVSDAKGTPGFNRSYTYTEKLIADLGRNFTNNIYYSRIREKLEEIKDAK